MALRFAEVSDYDLASIPQYAMYFFDCLLLNTVWHMMKRERAVHNIDRLISQRKPL